MRADVVERMPQREPASATPWQALKAVFSAFFGVRRAADHESVRLKPLHLVVAGLIGVAAFVLTLLTIVWLVTR
jgi:hypothetical protein